MRITGKTNRWDILVALTRYTYMARLAANLEQVIEPSRPRKSPLHCGFVLRAFSSNSQMSCQWLDTETEELCIS